MSKEHVLPNQSVKVDISNDDVKMCWRSIIPKPHASFLQVNIL